MSWRSYCNTQNDEARKILREQLTELNIPEELSPHDIAAGFLEAVWRVLRLRHDQQVAREILRLLKTTAIGGQRLSWDEAKPHHELEGK